MAATRDGFGEALLELGEENKQVVVLCADLAESTRTLAFKEKYPERYVEVGVAEQNLAAIASGMAAVGKIPFIASYAAFSPGRNYEQIRTTIALNRQKVIIAGMHAGISVGPDGATHQMLEDIGLMRMLPGMTVICPADSIEARKATRAAAELDGPVYLRFSREKTPVIMEENDQFVVGKARVMHDAGHPEVLIISTGVLLSQALIAAKSLANDFPVRVLHVATIKPIDREALVDHVREIGAVVTVEEHQIAGGLGSAVAEILASEYPVPIEYVGVHDRFGQSGDPSELMREYRLSAADIAAAARKVYYRKHA
jgi:transketolase